MHSLFLFFQKLIPDVKIDASDLESIPQVEPEDVAATAVDDVEEIQGNIAGIFPFAAFFLL